MKTNLGSGEKIIEGYDNVDIRPLSGVKVVASILDLPFEDDSIEEIYAADVLEHINYRKIMDALKEWYRILEPQGLLFIQVPDINCLIRHYNKANGVKKKEEAVRRWFGGQDYPENVHYFAFSPMLIKDYLRKSGFHKKITIESGTFGNYTNLRLWVKK